MAILNFGNTTARQKAPARWDVNSDGFDTLAIDMEVPASGLNAYLATLQKWSACPLDGAMYLADWTNDSNRQYPTVSLRYLGCRGGNLPSPKPVLGTSLSTSSATALDNGLHLDILYRSPFTQWKWISTSVNNDKTDQSNNTAPTIVTRRLNGGIPGGFDILTQFKINQLVAVTKDAPTQAKLSAVLAQVNAQQQAYRGVIANFYAVAFAPHTRVTSFTSEPVVPGHYYLNQSTVSTVLENTQGSF